MRNGDNFGALLFYCYKQSQRNNYLFGQIFDNASLYVLQISIRSNNFSDEPESNSGLPRQYRTNPSLGLSNRAHFVKF